MNDRKNAKRMGRSVHTLHDEVSYIAHVHPSYKTSSVGCGWITAI